MNVEGVLVWVLRLFTVAALAGGLYAGLLVFDHYHPDPWETSVVRDRTSVGILGVRQ